MQEGYFVVSGIIVAAGRGTRMGASENKVFLKIKDKCILEYTVEAFEECRDIDEIIIVTGDCDIDRCKAVFAECKKPLKIVSGGDTRQQSVYNGILASEGEIVAIHDGARALITSEIIGDTIAECKKYKAAAVGVMSKDTIKIITDDGFIKETTDRNRTYQIQTPQTFERQLILSAHEKGRDVQVTDDCALAEALGIPIKVVTGSYENIKITTPEDMVIAEGILEKRKAERK